MNSWQTAFRKLSLALELANIDSLRELETALESRHPPRRLRTAAAPSVAADERRARAVCAAALARAGGTC